MPAIIKSKTPEESRDLWGTPKSLFNLLDEEFNFVLDVCANEQNAKCENYINEEEDTLQADWKKKINARARLPAVFMNPPYAKGVLVKFLAKAVEEYKKGLTVVALLPASTGTEWWHTYIMGKACEVRFIKGRVQHEPPKTLNKPKNGPAFDSAVVIWKPISVGFTKFTSIVRW